MQYICKDTSPNVLETLSLLRFIGIDIFLSKQLCIMVSRKVTIRKFKILYFRNERCHITRNLKKKDLFLEHLQPLKVKNSKQIAVLISEFDDVTVKTTGENHLYMSRSKQNVDKIHLTNPACENPKTSLFWLAGYFHCSILTILNGSTQTVCDACIPFFVHANNRDNWGKNTSYNRC